MPDSLSIGNSHKTERRITGEKEMSQIRNMSLVVFVWGMLLVTLPCSISLAADDVTVQRPAQKLSWDISDIAGPLSEAGPSSITDSYFEFSGRSVSTWSAWLLGAVEFWLVGWIVVWSTLLLIRPGLILNANVLMRKFKIIHLPFFGTTSLTLSQLTFVSRFVNHSLVIDDWVSRQSDAVSEWLSIESDGGASGGQDFPVQIDGQAISLSDASTLRAMLPETPFLLAMHGDGKRWNDQVLETLLQQLISSEHIGCMLPHRSIPVVLDQNCVDRLRLSGSVVQAIPLWLQVVRNELCRISGVTADTVDHMLEALVRSRRIVPVVDQWSRIPDALQNALQTGVSNGEISCLVVIDDRDSVAEMDCVIRGRSFAAPVVVSVMQRPAHENTTPVTTPVANSVLDTSSVPGLIRGLEHSDADVRLVAAQSLGAMGTEAGVSVPALVALLNDPVTGCRQAAVDALGAIGAPAGPATVLLAEVALNDHRKVRAAACRALGAIGWHNETTVSALTQALKDADMAVRVQAARSVDALTVLSIAAVSAIEESIQKSDRMTQPDAHLATSRFMDQPTAA